MDLELDHQAVSEMERQAVDLDRRVADSLQVEVTSDQLPRTHNRPTVLPTNKLVI